MCGFEIILRQSSPNCARGDANDGIRVRLIIRRPTKDLDANRPFLNVVGSPGDCLFDDVAQERRIALAMVEMRACEYAVKLLANGFSLCFREGSRRNGC